MPIVPTEYDENGNAINTSSGNADGSQNADATNYTAGGELDEVRVQASQQDVNNSSLRGDWRVRLSLAPGSNYLYNDETNNLLAPLKYTNGVIFPYTPSISVSYNASYNGTQPVHSNYKIYQYESSNVDAIQISCDFTAQDTYEANYLLAVIHFFRSVTKMFYGQDEDPKPGTPPPMCFLHGMGQFQFSNSPLAINNFTYSLPNDVDYIRAVGYVTRPDGTSTDATNFPAPKASGGNGNIKGFFQTAASRLAAGAIANLGGVARGLLGNAGKLAPGGGLAGGFNAISASYNGTEGPTYVPTKIQLQIGAIPLVSRYDISNNFSVKNYANGDLLKKGFIW